MKDFTKQTSPGFGGSIKDIIFYNRPPRTKADVDKTYREWDRLLKDKPNLTHLKELLISRLKQDEDTIEKELGELDLETQCKILLDRYIQTFKK